LLPVKRLITPTFYIGAAGSDAVAAAMALCAMVSAYFSTRSAAPFAAVFNGGNNFF